MLVSHVLQKLILRVLPLGDGSEVLGATRGRHSGSGMFFKLPKCWGRLEGKRWTRNEVKGEGLGS